MSRRFHAVTSLSLVLLLAGCYGPGAPSGSKVASPGLEANQQPPSEQSQQPSVLAGEVHLTATNWGVLAYGESGVYRADRDALVHVGAYPDSASVRSEFADLGGDRLAVATADGAAIRLYVSDDRAATWVLAGSTSVDTIDGIVGIDLAWHGGTFVVLADEQSSSAFRFALLTISADGGVTWKTSQAPTGGRLSTANGWWWLTGGVSSDQVFRSVDGIDWHQVKVPMPAKEWTADRVIDVDGVGAVVPITVHNQDLESSVVFVATADGGQSWSEVGSTAAPPSASGSSIPSAIAADGSWIVVYVDGSGVISGRFGVDGAKVTSPNGLPENVTDIRMSTLSLTAVATPSSCPTGKNSCASSVGVFRSLDGGQTWAQVK